MRIGNLGSNVRASVDEFGAVALADGTLVSWLIGADDHWHDPHSTAATRQRFVEGLPIVATSMRVPGGDIVHTAYCVRSASGNDAVVIDFENASSLPVALAIMVSARRSVDLVGDTVVVDGVPTVRLGKTPAHMVCGSADEVRKLITTGAAPATWTGALESTWWQRRKHAPVCAGFVVPLTHRTTHRVAVSLGTTHRGPVSLGGDWTAEAPGNFADADAIVRGWDAHLRRGIRVESADVVAGEWARVRSEALLAEPSGDGAKRLSQWGFGDEAIAMTEALWVGGDLRGVVAGAAATWRNERRLPMIDGLDAVLGEVLRVASPDPELMLECGDVLEAVGQPDVAEKLRSDYVDERVFDTLANRCILRVSADSIDVCPDASLVVQGNQVAVYDAPTRFGKFGYAVRWHGDRPALLWTLETHEHVKPGSFTITAKSIDRQWASSQSTGEALLSTPSSGFAR